MKDPILLNLKIKKQLQNIKIMRLRSEIIKLEVKIKENISIEKSLIEGIDDLKSKFNDAKNISSNDLRNASSWEAQAYKLNNQCHNSRLKYQDDLNKWLLELNQEELRLNNLDKTLSKLMRIKKLETIKLSIVKESINVEELNALNIRC